ncbi:DUF3024 domain-containing protein [Algibacillus agarilyticus]|uniref:DUF3024 domain-containing protein n=1 Tax=Algibacillus agarilyticus TaxID=2234133 RepID=UPI000DD00A81|nr:DUF3024 domain-containing protein [Algibacillus agarilyticus]
MAISEFEIKRCERELNKFLTEHRPPMHLRDQIDISYKIENQTVEIFEIRPDFRDQNIKIEAPFAKATYVKSQNNWNIFWLKSDLKWHVYQPTPTVKLFESFLEIVSQDKHHCFFG